MDTFKGANIPFALFQIEGFGLWVAFFDSYTVLYMYLYLADSVTFKDIPPFIAVSGKD